MRWLPILTVSVLAFWISVSTAYADSRCYGLVPVVTHNEGLIIRGAATRLKAVAYTTPRIAGSDIEDLDLVREDFAAIKKAGFNAVRSYEPLAPAVLDVAEYEGLFVVQALIHLSDETNFDSEDELREVIQQVQRVMARDLCRPAVVMWSIWNDAPFNWGSSSGNVVERFGAHTVHRFLRRIRDAVRSMDTSRPLTAANVLNAKHAEIGMGLLDVIGVNVYLGVFDWPQQRYSHALAGETVARVKRLSQKYRRPVWISETGISSIPYADPAETVIPAQVRLIEKAGFAGFALFQWRDDQSKTSNGAQPSLDIESNWGLQTVRRAPKPVLYEIASALRGNAEHSEGVVQITQDQWISVGVDSQLMSQSRVLEDFRFDDSESVRAAYRVRSKGKCHVHYGSPGETGRRSNGMSLRYVPEDYGAWLILGRRFAKPIPLSRNERIVVSIQEHKGGSVNLVVIFGLTDGRTIRTPPLLLRSSKPQSYQLKLHDLIAGNGIIDDSVDITEISFRLNDVANFEDIGMPVQLVIKSILLVAEQQADTR